MSRTGDNGSLLLGLPLEIRQRIYDFLCTLPEREKDHEHITINAQHCWEISDYLECEGLLALMQTNRQLHDEITSYLYSPRIEYLLFYNDTAWMLEFLRTGPTRHLRHINLDFSNSFDPVWATRDAPESPRLSVDPVMSTLAGAAIGIEHLKLTIRPERSYTVSGIRGFSEFGPTMRIRGYSWMDPPIGIPPAPNESETEEFEKYLTGEFTHFVKSKVMVLSEDVEKDRASIEELLSGSSTNYNFEQINYLSGIWRRLWIIEDEKVFFGRELLEALGRLHNAHPLQSISLDGAIDRLWMAAVADLTGLSVRAKSWGTGWVLSSSNPNPECLCQELT